MPNLRNYYWSKLNIFWVNKCANAKISEEEMEIELDKLELMTTDELKKSYEMLKREGKV